MIFTFGTAIKYLTVIFCHLAFSARSWPFEKIIAGRGFLDFMKLGQNNKTNNFYFLQFQYAKNCVNKTGNAKNLGKGCCTFQPILIGCHCHVTLMQYLGNLKECKFLAT